MKHKSLLMIALGAAALLAYAGAGTTAGAGERRGSAVAQDAAAHPKTSYYHRKRGAQVYGYTARRGGYSYAPSDVTNTYGLTRNSFGSTNSYRNPWTDRQTISGPFDHGFFFNSAIGPQGGNSPYLH